MIFSNWLLMYLKDNEILQLIENSLNYLKVGGYFFIRESCFHASGAYLNEDIFLNIIINNNDIYLKKVTLRISRIKTKILLNIDHLPTMWTFFNRKSSKKTANSSDLSLFLLDQTVLILKLKHFPPII